MQGMGRAVIIGGAGIGDYAGIREILREDDYFIFCDGGLRHSEGLGVRPSLIVGDFDSHAMPERREDPDFDTEEPAAYGQKVVRTRTADGCEMIVLPHMKDWTDTAYAAGEVIRRGFREALLIGASGGRPDHYLGNISILLMLEQRGIEAWMRDDISEMRVLIGCVLPETEGGSGEPPYGKRRGADGAGRGNRVEISDSCRYFSLLAYDGPAKGVRIRNALYPLDDAVITAEEPYAVSNEVLPGQRAEVSVTEGKLLVIVITK